MPIELTLKTLCGKNVKISVDPHSCISTYVLLIRETLSYVENSKGIYVIHQGKVLDVTKTFSYYNIEDGHSIVIKNLSNEMKEPVKESVKEQIKEPAKEPVKEPIKEPVKEEVPHWIEDSPLEDISPRFSVEQVHANYSTCDVMYISK